MVQAVSEKVIRLYSIRSFRATPTVVTFLNGLYEKRLSSALRINNELRPIAQQLDARCDSILST